MTITEWALVAIAVVVVAGLIAALTLRSRSDGAAVEEQKAGRARPARDHFGGREPAAEPQPRAAVIVNPTKFDDVEAVRASVTQVCTAEGWAEPMWIETTEDDPGEGQTRQALEAGVDLVCPLGGDGTVRTVGEVLAGTDTPMGLLPGGTGNLLARNLDLPIDSVDKALRVALTGRNKPIDVGRVTGDDGLDKVFLVMAGMGFDADIMANTDEDLKSKVGWAAYLVSGAQHLVGPRFRARITTDDETFTRRTRSIIVGNVGKLQGGMQLMPDAVPDDGHLDALVLSPRGVVGWAAVAARLSTGNRKGHTLVTHHTTTHLRVQAGQPVQLQIDGDPLDKVEHASFVVEPRALVVRVAATTNAPETFADRVENARTAVRDRIEAGPVGHLLAPPAGATSSSARGQAR